MSSIPENGSFVDLGYGFSWNVEIVEEKYQIYCWIDSTHHGYISVADISLYLNNILIETQDISYIPNPDRDEAGMIAFQLSESDFTGTKTIKVILNITERANMPSEYGFYDDICTVAKTSVLERTIVFPGENDKPEPDDPEHPLYEGQLLKIDKNLALMYLAQQQDSSMAALLKINPTTGLITTKGLFTQGSQTMITPVGHFYYKDIL